ncbi:MAG TPA: hypothetical protein PKJ56_08630 [Promineifilum sp.]|nr:hypothetical protein [Promineifilum sp.]
MDGIGFPGWTLWGMGLAAFGALVTIALAYLAQSPRMLARLNLGNERLDLRAKAFTGYALALLLLAMGFFLAGVPLDRSKASTETPAPPNVAGLFEEGDAGALSNPGEAVASDAASGQPDKSAALPSGPSTGAMGGLAIPQPSLEPDEVISDTVEIALPPGPEEGQEEATAAPAGTPAPTDAPTRVPTATPTSTPSPTPTPTPILAPTAKINDQTSTLSVRRLPGGTPLVTLLRGDTVILLTGNAFYRGELWQEIQTVNGIVGWLQDRFLDYDTSE